MTTEPTPTPWTTGGIANPDGPDPRCNLWGPRAKPESQSGPMIAENIRLKDAALILTAVNSHAALVSACRAALEVIEQTNSVTTVRLECVGYGGTLWMHRRTQALAQLRAARGETKPLTRKDGA